MATDPQTEPSTDDGLERLQAIVEWYRKAAKYRDTHQREIPPDWYDWQHGMFDLGGEHVERMVLAGNQTGKTVSSTYEHALHITGDYQSYENAAGREWRGLTVPRAGNYYGLAVSNSQLRKVMQRKLFGTLEGEGFSGGWIHPDEVTGFTRSNAEQGLASTVTVKHKVHGESTISLFAHTQSKTGHGSLNIAGETVDGILCDEQPEDAMIGQLAARRVNGRDGQGGYVLYAMTPERGMTDLVHQFMTDPGPGQVLIGPIAWSECPHITPDVRETLLASIPPHEREMREKGVPLFGSGRVFRFDEDQFLIEPFPIPAWYLHIRAIDIGIDHPTAISWLAMDPEQGNVYLVKTYRSRGGDVTENAAIHAAVANRMWPNVPMVVPHDIDNREPGSGKTTEAFYRDAGIRNTLMFENPGGGRGVEVGLMAMQQAMDMGQFHGFRGHCEHFVEESRTYHRKDGKVVPIRDDSIAATRYGFQMIANRGVRLTPQDTRVVGAVTDGSMFKQRERTSSSGRPIFSLHEVVER